LTLRENAPVERADLLSYLDQKNIGTRLLFGGNLLKQPYMVGRAYRVASALTRTDIVMHRTFWIGVYPGLGTDQLEYVCELVEAFLGVRFR
jgi:CDP-6-deoxy-D-xylo-4-hexulose-3-dehydrase